MQREPVVVDRSRAMSQPRNLYSDTTLYVTCRCVNRSFRLVPTKRVRRIFRYAFAVVSEKYRRKFLMRFFEFEVLSTHYHLVLQNGLGKVTDFLQELNSLIARELNAVRGTSGKFFEPDPGIQTILGDERVLEHAVYTLANAVAAGLVNTTTAWKGENSLRLAYGKAYPVSKPKIGLWSNKRSLANRREARRSKRAAYSGRSTLPELATLMLDRPPILPELSDAQLRAKIRERLVEREQTIAKLRGRRAVVGMKAALKVHWSTIPLKGEEMFCMRPTLSTQTKEQRKQMKRLRLKFLAEYAEALRLWILGRRDVVFPAGTTRMRLRFLVPCEPLPLDLLLAG